MGHMQSTLSGQYFPTNERICSFLSFLHFGIKHKDENQWKYREEYLNPYLEIMHKKPEFKFKKDWYKIPSYSQYYFQEAIKNNDMDYIKNNFEIPYSKYLRNGSLKTVILDPMAGQGDWLIFPYNFNPNFVYSKEIYTIAVELVEERANICKENKCNKVFHSDWESMILPLKCVSILNFNPPYDSIKLEDGSTERLTKYYLRDIINKDILAPEGFIDVVIRQDDFIDCLDLLHEYFILDKDLIFKAPDDEYGKFKQVVFVAKKRNSPFSKNSMSDYWRNESLKNKMELAEYVNSAPVIDVTKINEETLKNTREYPIIDIELKEKLFKMSNKSKEMISNSDNVWNWFQEMTEINEYEIGDIRVALPQKSGELTNVLASGLVNGLVAEGTEKNHVVCGGIEQIEETKTEITYDENNKQTKTIITQKINKPYLNVLANGQIIKLINNKNNIVESEDIDIE